MSQHQLRHCMVVHSYYPLGETRVQREAAALTERGWEVDVVCLREPGEARSAVHEGVNVIRLPVRRHRGSSMAVQLLEYLYFFALATWRLIWLQRNRRYQTIQVHNLPDFLVFAAVWPKLRGARVILDLHDLMPELFAARTSSGMKSRAARVLLFQERLACRFADHVITVTDWWRETLVARGVPRDKTSVVMNLADPGVFRRNGERSAQPSSEFRVLYHGTFTRRYGVDVLVRAVAEANVPGIRLRLLGDGETRSELRELARQLGIAEEVELSAGMVRAEDLPTALKWADVGVVPNRRDVFTDGILPTKLLELAVMGVPAIVARTNGVAEYFTDDMVRFFEAGDVAALAAALQDLAKDPEARHALGQRIQNFNLAHSWDEAAIEYAATVAGLAGVHGGGQQGGVVG